MRSIDTTKPDRKSASPVFFGPGTLPTASRGRLANLGTRPVFIGLCRETDPLFRAKRFRGIDLSDTECRQKARYPGNREQ